MGSNCYGCTFLEFVAARISRLQFAQRYVICIYGVRITFVLFTPVPETGYRNAGFLLYNKHSHGWPPRNWNTTAKLHPDLSTRTNQLCVTRL